MTAFVLRARMTGFVALGMARWPFVLADDGFAFGFRFFSGCSTFTFSALLFSVAL